MKELIKAIKAEAENKKQKAVNIILNGYGNDADRELRQYSTPKNWEKYTAGTLSRDEAAKRAIKRADAEIDKQAQKDIEHVNTVENAPSITDVKIVVDWVKNSYWGMNPHATVTAWSGDAFVGEHFGKASGYGYDKQSAAICEAFNKCDALLKLLYQAEERRLEENATTGQSTSRRDFIGYGSGYGVLPYFEGGCGVSVFYKIFESGGFKFESIASGKSYDIYTIKKA